MTSAIRPSTTVAFVFRPARFGGDGWRGYRSRRRSSFGCRRCVMKAQMRPLFTEEHAAASAGLFLDGLLGTEREY